MKKLFCIFALVFALIMSGCAEFTDEDKKLPEAEMPDIVFMKRTVYNEYEHDIDYEAEQGRYMLAFFDKNGEYYTSTYNEIFLLSFEELVDRYRSGDERIVRHDIKCDVGELRDNFKKLLEVSANEDYELLYPRYLPTVEAGTASWYGLYYDNEGKISSVILQDCTNTVMVEANDERANNIYRWYNRAARNNKIPTR